MIKINIKEEDKEIFAMQLPP